MKKLQYGKTILLITFYYVKFGFVLDILLCFVMNKAETRNAIFKAINYKEIGFFIIKMNAIFLNG